MNRSGYIDVDFDDHEMQWHYIRGRGALKSAIRGARGQRFLRELIEALDAMPKKELAAGLFQEEQGRCCALGAWANHKGIDLSPFEPEPDDGWGDESDNESLSEVVGIAVSMVREIEWENDEWHGDDASRWRRMRSWAERNLNSSEKEPTA